ALDVDLSTLSVTFGQDSAGGSTLSISADVKQGGKKIGTLNMSFEKNKDGQPVLQTVLNLEGDAALKTLEAIFGVSDAKQLVDRLAGQPMTITDQDGREIGTISYAVSGDLVTMTVTRLNDDGTTSTQQVQFNVNDAFGGGATFRLSIGGTGDGH